MNMNENKEFSNDLFDVLSNAFNLLGFNVDEKTVKELGKNCKDKACNCKDKIGKKIEETKDGIKRMITSNSEMREFIDGGKYTLQIVATGYDETMVRINVDKNAGNIIIHSIADVDAVWFMPNIDMTVKLPDGIIYQSLKKNIVNGLITVTGDIQTVTDEDCTFTL